MFWKKKRNVANVVEGINIYHKQVAESDIRNDLHRKMVGGFWEEIGCLQFDFLKRQGLDPKDKLLDIGCGCLRGGIHFIEYLDTGNYFGLDVNESLLMAGKLEVEKKGLVNKDYMLIADDKFDFSLFKSKFKFAIAISLFTHLPMNLILKCLKELSLVLEPGGNFYATFFEAPEPIYFENIIHTPGSVTTYYFKDPFHYSFKEFQHMADLSGLSVKYVGDWAHPRGQKMLLFEHE